jgi:predicted ester cyclase
MMASMTWLRPASGKPVNVTVFDQARVSGGRIAEHWGVPDRFAGLAQTGLLGHARSYRRE